MDSVPFVVSLACAELVDASNHDGPLFKPVFDELSPNGWPGIGCYSPLLASLHQLQLAQRPVVLDEFGHAGCHGGLERRFCGVGLRREDRWPAFKYASHFWAWSVSTSGDWAIAMASSG